MPSHGTSDLAKLGRDEPTLPSRWFLDYDQRKTYSHLFQSLPFSSKTEKETLSFHSVVAPLVGFCFIP